MKISKEEATDIVFGDHSEWTMVDGTREKEMLGKQLIGCSAVFEHKPTGKFYMFQWDEIDNEWGCEPFEYMEPNPVQVEEVERIVKSWVPVSSGDKD